jgi:ATP:corrinoid adenosyltransferase
MRDTSRLLTGRVFLLENAKTITEVIEIRHRFSDGIQPLEGESQDEG